MEISQCHKNGLDSASELLIHYFVTSGGSFCYYQILELRPEWRSYLGLSCLPLTLQSVTIYSRQRQAETELPVTDFGQANFLGDSSKHFRTFNILDPWVLNTSNTNPASLCQWEKKISHPHPQTKWFGRRKFPSLAENHYFTGSLDSSDHMDLLHTYKFFWALLYSYLIFAWYLPVGNFEIFRFVLLPVVTQDDVSPSLCSIILLASTSPVPPCFPGDLISLLFTIHES